MDSYLPSMYNRKITHKACKKSFGIFHFAMSKAKEEEERSKIASEVSHVLTGVGCLGYLSCRLSATGRLSRVSCGRLIFGGAG